MIYHKPVLLQATLDLLDVKPDGLYIDATLGGGGHALEIIRRGGKVIGIDQDQQAITTCSALYSKEIQSHQLVLVNANFSHLSDIVRDYATQPILGILMDIGVSSHQLDTPQRGFSFQSVGPLDMRMDNRLGVTAQDIVNTWPKNALINILQKFGELPASAKIAQTIINNRPFATTTELAQHLGSHTRQVFQAIRIAVNDELNSLTTGLSQSFEALASNGVIAVISFHSLEDRIVKDQFREWQSHNFGTVLTLKPIIADESEQTENSRSKSAKLRAFKKL